MRLNRLELYGFKSFADRTVLSFERALTGIVGPNGCGKSNVVDAMRWVLGETRPTSMRGGEMVDVIFKGSTSRPAMSVAEVTLVLGNEDGRIEGRGSEIAISRRVYASGEGEYRLDGERVRLKDVRDMLFDTGLGSRGYAVLEQGRIDAVLSANPLDRRAIFEEAAGISRYRSRRKETEVRLARVDQDMLRLDDVLSELGTRLRSLKLQAGKAERYVAAHDAWREQRTRYVRHRLCALSGALERVNAELSELDRRAAALRTLRTEQEGDAGACLDEQRELSAAVDRQSAEVAHRSAEARAREERQAHLGQSSASARRSAAEEADRALLLASQLERREAERERVSAQALEGAEVLARLERQVSTGTAELARAREALSRWKASCEQAGAGLLRLLAERTEADNSVRHLESGLEGQAERGERAEQRLKRSLQSLEEATGLSQQVALRLAAERENLEAWSGRVGSLERELEVLAAELEQAERERTALELDQARTKSRIEALRDWEREREGLESGARALLGALGSAGAPCSAERLRGVVADHLRTSTRLASALDTALGAEALALVVADARAAERIAAWMSAQRTGPARLRLPSGIAPVPPTGRDWTSELSAEEAATVEGALLDELSVEPGFEPLARWLVGDVLVVRDREASLRLVERHPRWRCVTPSGELVDALGLIAGQREIAQGPVGRRSSADELERDLAALDARLAQAAEAVARLAERRARLSAELSAARIELEAARAAESGLAAEERTARARLSDLEVDRDLAERERAHQQGEGADLARALEQQRARQERSAAEHQAGSVELAELERERQAAEERLGELQAALAQSQAQTARARAEVEGLEQRARDLERSEGEARSELERSRRIAREQGESARSADAEAEQVGADRQVLEASRAVAARELEALRERERAGRQALEGFRERVERATRELEALSERLSSERLEAQRVELEAGELRVRALEELGQDERQLLRDFEPEAELAGGAALTALGEEVAELKRRLDSIGPVNTEALDELERERARADFLAAQRGDLNRSKQGLEEALRAINAESLRLFSATFEDVRGHFELLFRQLFGGGKADLTLGEGDPLEAGIEISARPPGREMLPIGLLSGGQRTLTALALLFAVFRARPSPFCVLDEVDAALDDANVGRFLGLLDSFLSSAQFLVVTHNKGTMAACDALYGITMETKGVSTHVAVEFHEVARFVPQATGDASRAAHSRAAAAAEAPAPEPAAGTEVEAASLGKAGNGSWPSGGGTGHGAPHEPPAESIGVPAEPIGASAEARP